jgi:hypothetical protein
VGSRQDIAWARKVSQAGNTYHSEAQIPKLNNNFQNNSGDLTYAYYAYIIYIMDTLTTKDEPKTHQPFNVRMPIELLQWIRAEAKKNHRSATGEILMAIEAWKKSKEIMTS